MSNKKIFEDYIFGYADAELEFSRTKKIFEDAFYDPKNIVDKLINDHEFILIGRKGVGKTAFGAKIRSLSEKDYNLKTNLMSLSKFEFNTFNKLKISELDGTQKYKSSWDLTLLIYIYKLFRDKYEFTEVKEINERIEFLEKNGLLSGKNVNSIIRKLSKKSFQFDIKIFKLNNENEYEDGKLTYGEVSEYLLEGLSYIYYGDIKVRIIIDGLDDMLRFKKERLIMISGLIRSINELNIEFTSEEIPMKIILLAREDILASIIDPDFNKIKRDAGIVINWNTKDDELKNMVKLRFKLSGIKEDDLDGQWDKLFPRMIKSKTSWDYVTEFTLNRPRDILQFLVQCQKNYPNNSSLSYSELDRVLISYSIDYFIEEMKNELAGFIDDEAISAIPQVLQIIGGSDFTDIEFKKHMAKIIPDKQDTYYKQILLTLFENGYLGQVTRTKQWDKELKKDVIKNKVFFKHKQPTARINYECKFSTHKGLYKALNITKK